MDKLMVEKRNGRLQDFNRSKLRASLVHAGASPEEAEGVTIQVESWLSTEKGQGVVKSSEIRARATKFLEQLNPDATQNYASYAKK